MVCFMGSFIQVCHFHVKALYSKGLISSRGMEANIALTCICITFLPSFWKFHITPLFSVFRQPSLILSIIQNQTRGDKSDSSSGWGLKDPQELLAGQPSSRLYEGVSHTTV